jgi:4-amino-4-deoxy-L-arabinose transferase-like glycosyltransferase
MASTLGALLNRRPLLWLLGLTAVLYLWNLSRVELSVTDEARSAMIVRDMQAGHWLLPRTPDGYLVEKPPVFYGTCALLGSVFGVNEWTLRGVSVLAMLGTLALTAWIVRLYGSPRAALIAVVALASNMFVLSSGRDAMVDMMLTFFLTAGFAGYYAGRLGRITPEHSTGICGLAFGLAVLCKGPLGLALPIAVCGGDLLMESRGRFWTVRRVWAPALGSLLLACVVASLWYVPGLIRGKGEFLETSILSENFRMPTGHASGIGVAHHKPWHYYLLRQLAGFLPVLPLLATLPAWFRAKESGVARRQLAAWALFGFLLFQIASNKRYYYLVTIQPAIAVMIGLAADAWAIRIGAKRWSFLLTGVLAILAGLVVTALAFAPQWLQSQRGGEISAAIVRHRAWIIAFTAALTAAGVGLVAACRRGPTLVLVAASALALLVVAVRTGAGDRFEADFNRSRPFIEATFSKVPPTAQPVIWPPIWGYSLDFYWPQPLVRDAAAAHSAEYVFINRLHLSELEGAVETLGTWRYGDVDRDILLVRRLP